MNPVLTPDVLRFALVILVFAGWIVLHLDLFRRTATATLLTPLQRVLCIAPPFAVYYAYRLGARRRAVLSVALVVVYVALRRYR